MGILKCAHGMSGLDWRVTSEGKVEVRVSETPDSAGGDATTEWQCYGEVLDVLDRLHDKAFEETELTHDRVAGVAVSFAEGTRIGQTSEAVGMRLDPMRWRALAPNAVIHFQFGPGITVATDGTQVLVFSFARWGTDCAVVHRNNIRGPVTSTPIRTNEWDYVTNKPKQAPRSGANNATPKLAKESRVLARAMAALESLLA